jgi:hypothetical protein
MTMPHALYRLRNDPGPLWSPPMSTSAEKSCCYCTKQIPVQAKVCSYCSQYQNRLWNNFRSNSPVYLLVSMALIAVAIGQLLNSTKQAGIAGRQILFAEEQLKLAKEEHIKAQEALERASQAEQATKNLGNLVQKAEQRTAEIQSILETVTTRAKTIEDTSKKTTERLGAVIVQAQSAEQRLREADERESLRQVAMWLPNGALASDVQGSMRIGPPKNQATELRKKIFVLKGHEITMGGERCHTPEYMDALRDLIKLNPHDPYLLVLSVHCLKALDDSYWRDEGIKTLRYLNKLVKIQPHVNFLDSFYDVLANEFGDERSKRRGRFRVNEDGSYIIGNWDNSVK